ncbi:DUF167 domain-containing protein [bacterium]|nr:DUF167 domain-containing protein [bacterium]
MELELKNSGNSVSFPVKAVPRASRNAIADVREGALVVRLCAPPVEGKANEALVAFLAECLGVRKKQVSIKSGDKSRHKIVVVTDISESLLLEKLQGCLPSE